MLTQIQLLAAYNLWADERLIKVIFELDDSQLDLEVKSSFSSLRKTLAHMYDAEKIWLNRLRGTTLDHWPSHQLERFEIELLLEESRACFNYVQQVNEQDINTLCVYQGRKGNSFSHSRGEILMHVFNHATYHRGQLVNMLRQIGVESIPATDLIHYLRERD